MNPDKPKDPPQESLVKIPKVEIIPKEEHLPYDEIIERDFELRIRVSLEKLSGYEDSRLLAIYPEYAFNVGRVQTGEPLRVMTVAEIREKVLNMRDPQKNLTGEWLPGRASPQAINIVYDDLVPGTSIDEVRERWQTFYKGIDERRFGTEGNPYAKIGTPENHEATIEESTFEGLNRLRGLKDDHILAIRDSFDYSLRVLTVAELRAAIQDMGNPDNELTHGFEFPVMIEVYDHTNEYASLEQIKLSLEDVSQKEYYLGLVEKYPDDELVTWRMPKDIDISDPGKGRGRMLRQDTAANMRQMIREASHDGLRFWSDLGGIQIVATGEVDFEQLQRQFEANAEAFQMAIQAVVDKVNARVAGEVTAGRLDDGTVIDVGQPKKKLSRNDKKSLPLPKGDED